MAEPRTVGQYRKANPKGMRRARAEAPAPAALAGRHIVTIELEGVRTKAETNQHAYWRGRNERAKRVRGGVLLQLAAQVSRWRVRDLPLPIRVRLTRIAPRLLDEGDNLQSALKAARDGVADWLGLDDRRSSPIEWNYHQEQQSKRYGVRVEVHAGEAP